MTPAEITAYVMALPVEDVRRLSATDVMGWELRYNIWMKDGECKCMEYEFRPDEDRNQSRMVTDKVQDYSDLDNACRLLHCYDAMKVPHWTELEPDYETRAALIAYMIHTQEAGE